MRDASHNVKYIPRIIKNEFFSRAQQLALILPWIPLVTYVDR